MSARGPWRGPGPGAGVHVGRSRRSLCYPGAWVVLPVLGQRAPAPIFSLPTSPGALRSTGSVHRRREEAAFARLCADRPRAGGWERCSGGASLVPCTHQRGVAGRFVLLGRCPLASLPRPRLFAESCVVVVRGGDTGQL